MSRSSGRPEKYNWLDYPGTRGRWARNTLRHSIFGLDIKTLIFISSQIIKLNFCHHFKILQSFFWTPFRHLWRVSSPSTSRYCTGRARNQRVTRLQSTGGEYFLPQICRFYLDTTIIFIFYSLQKYLLSMNGWNQRENSFLFIQKWIHIRTHAPVTHQNIWECWQHNDSNWNCTNCVSLSSLQLYIQRTCILSNIISIDAFIYNIFIVVWLLIFIRNTS